ncbi:MAG TPA: DUF1801 domain-containing protein [Gemmatimonadales bacterium]|nr:DUF1801 domain-containing protein [Gemmatimonadales bacterium]
MDPKVKKYFDALTPQTRKALKQLREVARAAAPGAEEVISYGIVGLRLERRMVVWYAGFKNHMSLYPMSKAFERANAAAIKAGGYEISGRGTIRFPLDKKPPAALVRRFVKSRIADVKAKK